MAIAVVYIVFKDKKQAEKITSLLLKEKLIACANIFQISSLYTWKNKLVHKKEFAAFCKTKHALVNLVEARVKELHSYEVPCVLSWTADSNREFENWVFESTSNLY